MQCHQFANRHKFQIPVKNLYNTEQEEAVVLCRGVEGGEEDDEVVEDATNHATNEVTVDNATNHEVPVGTVLADATNVIPLAENSIDDDFANTQYEGEAWD